MGHNEWTKLNSFQLNVVTWSRNITFVASVLIYWPFFYCLAEELTMQQEEFNVMQREEGTYILDWLNKFVEFVLDVTNYKLRNESI